MYMKSADFDPQNPSGIDSTYLKNSGGQNPRILTPRILGTDLGKSLTIPPLVDLSTLPNVCTTLINTREQTI